MICTSALRPNVTANIARTASPSASAAPNTTVSSTPTDLVSLSGAQPASKSGKNQAIQLAGMGVMFGSIMAGPALGTPYGPVVMIGGMFAGMAIMALGND